MKDKIKSINIEKLKKTVNTVVLIISLILLVLTINYSIKQYNQVAQYVKTTATITTLNYAGNEYIATVEYRVENQDYTNEMRIKATNITVNDQIEIKYNKNNPNVLSTTNYIKELIILIPSSLILLIISLKSLLKRLFSTKKTDNLKQNGILIYATIDQVYINNKKPKKKGVYPYRIRAKYINPQDNLTYTFESEDTYENIKLIIENNNIRTIPVYLNKDNTYIYYVDLRAIITK